MHFFLKKQHGIWNKHPNSFRNRFAQLETSNEAQIMQREITCEMWGCEADVFREERLWHWVMSSPHWLLLQALSLWSLSLKTKQVHTLLSQFTITAEWHKVKITSVVIILILCHQDSVSLGWVLKCFSHWKTNRINFLGFDRVKLLTNASKLS